MHATAETVPATKPTSDPAAKRRKLILISTGAAVAAIGVTLYLIHAFRHESTDDAYLTGHIHSVASRVDGTVREVAVDDNDRVKQGQTLVHLDPRDFQVAVDRAQAEYHRAQADLDRIEGLKGDKAISSQDYDRTEAAALIAQAALDDANNQLDYCTIVAPTDGGIGSKTVQVGNRVSVGTTLMTVVQDYWVVANFKETQIARMHEGQPVSVRIDAIPGRKFVGHIDSLSPGAGSVFALLPPENATGNFTKIVQRVPVKIILDPESIQGCERRLVPGLSVIADVEVAR